MSTFSLTFPFEINSSFLKYPTHPITVPKSIVDYDHLKAEMLHQGEFVVIFPKGERITAKMYFNAYPSGYRPYYQLRLRGGKRAVPNYVKIGDKFFVALVRMGRKSYAIVEQGSS